MNPLQVTDNNRLLEPICSACNLIIKPSSAKTLFKKFYCDICFHQITFQCNLCKKFYPRSQAQALAEDFGQYCIGCIKTKFLPCSVCKKVIHRNNIPRYTFQGTLYCQYCLARKAFYCHMCHKIFEKIQERNCVGCYSSFCPKCYRLDDCRADGVGDAKLIFRKGKQSRLVSNARFLAVEIEATCLGDTAYRLVKLPKTFGKGRDGSVPNGMEIKTPPCSGTAFIKTIHVATEALKKAKYITDTHCGLHLHIDLREKVKDFKFLAHLLMTFFAIEDVLFAMQPDWRRKSGFCPALRTQYKFFDFYDRAIYDFDYKVYKQDKAKIQKAKIEEYKKDHQVIERGAFNFQSVFFRGSLEIRLQAGTLEPIKILRWADLMQRIIKWVETSYNYDTVLHLLAESVTENKLKMFKRVFKIGDPLFHHILHRIKETDGMGYKLPFQIGALPKKMAHKKILQLLPKKIVQERDLTGKNIPVMIY